MIFRKTIDVSIRAECSMELYSGFECCSSRASFSILHYSTGWRYTRAPVPYVGHLSGSRLPSKRSRTHYYSRRPFLVFRQRRRLPQGCTTDIVCTHTRATAFSWFPRGRMDFPKSPSRRAVRPGTRYTPRLPRPALCTGVVLALYTTI